MKVRELIKMLQSEPNQDREVFMARDPEGNGHSPLRGAWCGSYLDGEVGMESIDDEDRKHGYTEEDILDGVPALILTPTH